ncbi:envelope stress response membrane protein PspC [Aliikangiella marina]|uniref:Envelope stress response membrane protein PspC n=1 Tax=Aliikangiella marina TaxID=1712262 RepID=A0A545TDX9_9GAMM|nr:envelope stress response membrane protein PspC [Aliikangiella marina]TQV75432.1 envelope stress response membrane protein PspC [Aliikangiella marina]
MDNSSYSPRERRRLYKDPDRGKICGVCAGIAEYLGLEVWVVRIIAVSLLIFVNGAVLVAYIVMCFVLDPKPGHVSNRGCFGSERKRRKPSESDDSRPYRPTVKDVWSSGTSPKDLFSQVEDKFSVIEKKLQKMESYVTSNKFNLDQEFKKMAD